MRWPFERRIREINPHKYTYIKYNGWSWFDTLIKYLCIKVLATFYSIYNMQRLILLLIFIEMLIAWRSL